MEYKEIIKKAIKDFKVIKEELLDTYYKGYVGKQVYQYTLADGTTKKCDKIIKAGRNGDAVGIIPITKENNILMIVQSRPVTSDQVLVEFPAGMIDPGELPIIAAQRELLEETGYKTDELELLEWHYQDQGCSGAIVYTYVAYNCEKVNEQNLDETENINYFEVTENEMFDIINNKDSYVHDANTKIAALTYQLKKKDGKNERI